MKQQVIVDTGVLVAIINKNDSYHGWAIQQFSNIQPPLLTCEAIISEACFLLRRYQQSNLLLQWLEKGVLSLPFSLQNEIQPLNILLKKYSDVPMSLADGCLVRLAEIYPQSQILTLDSDFKVYRKNGNQLISLIFPDIIE
ncbi:type II toxin-antitoxin system VapC family toxin [Methylobacter sp. S3L5C]|uniref:type II toxin-antitoxin system VapC family toxin n=1 Tax=Methylobacter sp. S3L5C TaxID=2839024 RepID=UPI001FABA12E|nr:PIN domain-containing protein [Methylobacter sp. S3L5C]UOA09500.1 PIN domain-containing protein [Methylobacter sp. S3L5C]